MDSDTVKKIIEAALLAADRPLRVEELAGLFTNSAEGASPSPDNTADNDTVSGKDATPPSPIEGPDRRMIRSALSALERETEGRCVELKEIASGFHYRIRSEYAPYIQRLWIERPARYSRALLETLAIIAYRQPVSRGEIEEIRGVSVSSSILKTLREREWIRVVGHRDLPGRPAIYGTTRAFLDYFGLKSLEDMPPLGEIKVLDGQIEIDFEMSAPSEESISHPPPSPTSSDDADAHTESTPNENTTI